MLGKSSLYLLWRARVKYRWQYLPWHTAVTLIQNAVCKSFHDAIFNFRRRQFQQGARNTSLGLRICGHLHGRLPFKWGNDSDHMKSVIHHFFTITCYKNIRWLWGFLQQRTNHDTATAPHSTWYRGDMKQNGVIVFPRAGVPLGWKGGLCSSRLTAQ